MGKNQCVTFSDLGQLLTAMEHFSDVLYRVKSTGDECNEQKCGILRMKPELLTSVGCAVELKVKPDFPYLNNTS